MAVKIQAELEEGDPALEVLVPSLLSVFNRLLDNAGYHKEDAGHVLANLVERPNEVYDIENQRFGTAEELGIFDATKAVSEALRNSVEIAGVLGTLGGIVVHPRDAEFERKEASLDEEWRKVSNDSSKFTNPKFDK